MAKPLRRANGEGTIRERVRDGKTVGWEALVSYIDLETGQMRRKSLSAKTRPAVLERKRLFERELQQMGGLPSQERTVAILLDAWLEEKRLRVGVKADEDYTRVVEKRLKPALGALPLARLKLADVEQMMRDLVGAGKTGEANRALARLRMALAYAVTHGWTEKNVAAQCPPVPVREQQHQIWQPDEVVKFLRYTEGSRYHVMYIVFLATGMRSGEVRGLQWGDIDLDAGIIWVQRQWLEAARAQDSRFAPPKRDSTRRIHIQEDLISLLRTHRVHLQDRQQEMEEAYAWSDLDLVFPSLRGTPMLATNLLRQFREDARRAGVPGIRLHDMRDTAASTLLASGTPLILVSEILLISA
jgi:integrase